MSKRGIATLFDARTWNPVRTSVVPAQDKAKSVSSTPFGSLLIVLNDGTPVQEQMLAHGAQNIVATKPAEVTVWYATNRIRLDTAASFLNRWWMTIARIDYLIAMAACFLVCIVMVIVRPLRRYSLVPLVGLPAFLVLAAVSVAFQSSKATSVPGSALSNDVSEGISWGRCLVSVPSSREALGEVPAPADPLGFGGDADPGKHFILVSENPRTADQVANEIKSIESPDPPEEILLFVHGFNVPFEAVAKRTAQLKLDLRIDGPAFFFSWPSYGREALYTWDEDNAEASDMAFETMLRELSKRYPDSKMHILAHSMGTRIVMEALCRIHRQTTGDHPRVDSLVLAAPDIDRRQFKIKMAEIVKKTNFPVTLYASSKDWALRFSYVANKNDRLGHTQPELVISEGMESIDASRIDTDFLGHGYYGDERELLGDLHQLFKDKRFADKRFGLRLVEDGEKRWWVLLP